MEYRAKDGIFHAYVRFCIVIFCICPYVCNTFSQKEFKNPFLKIESNFCLTKK